MGVPWGGSVRSSSRQSPGGSPVSGLPSVVWLVRRHGPATGLTPRATTVFTSGPCSWAFSGSLPLLRDSQPTGHVRWQQVEALRNGPPDRTQVSKHRDRQPEAAHRPLLRFATSEVVDKLPPGDAVEPSRSLRGARAAITALVRERSRKRLSHQLDRDLWIETPPGQKDQDSLRVLLIGRTTRSRRDRRRPLEVLDISKAADWLLDADPVLLPRNVFEQVVRTLASGAVRIPRQGACRPSELSPPRANLRPSLASSQESV